MPSVAEAIDAVVSFQPIARTFVSPAVCALGYVTATELCDDCGVASASWTNVGPGDAVGTPSGAD